MVAPAVAPVVGIVVSIEALLSWVVAAGLLWVYRGTLQDILLGLANRIDGVGISTRIGSIHPLDPLADQLRRVDNVIQEGLEDWVRGNEIILAGLWDAITGSMRSLGKLVADTAESVAHTYATIWRTLIPQAEDRAVQRAKRAGAAIAAAVATLTTVALPRIRADVGALGGKVGRLDDALDWTRARVKAHERLLVGAGVAALGLRILSRLRLGWLRCSKVGRVGRATCGLDPDLLDALLFSTVAMFGTYSLVQFAEEMQDATDELAPLIRRFWRAT